MSYILGVILSLSLINTIFLVNNLKTHTENKKQLDNLYNFTIHNINNVKQDMHNEKQDMHNEKQDLLNEKQDLLNEKQKSIINHTELSDSVTQGIPQWSFFNLGRSLKQKSSKPSLSLSLSKIE